MTELKTLKDIDENYQSVYKSVGVRELKSEAVKWIKYYQIQINKCRELNQDNAIFHYQSKIDVLRAFFDIIQSDLEEQSSGDKK